MSLITTAEATPSRFLGTYRYLVEHGPLSGEELAARIWPEATRSGDFLGKIRLEMLELGLLEEREGQLWIGTRVPAPACESAVAAERELPVVISDLVMRGSERSRDLAYSIAWLVGFDPLGSPMDESATVRRAADDNVTELIKVTSDVTYNMLEDWVPYLGFGWIAPPRPEVKSQLIPDPTAYIRRILPDLLPEVGQWVPIESFRANLAARAPVFEGGDLRAEVDGRCRRRTAETEIAASTTVALSRLVEEGLLQLSAPSDAAVHLLAFGENRRVAMVTRRELEAGAR